MAKVELISFTGKGLPNQDWHAADLMIFSKQTRLNMTTTLMEEVANWSNERKLEELQYMARTIPSSWEMIDVVFLVTGVSRATAQQITRTRNASYVMQSQRVTDQSKSCVYNPHKPGTDLWRRFEVRSTRVMELYSEHVLDGAQQQEARGLLPMNVECTLLCKYNLRAFADLVRSRSSLRAQGEYVDIAAAMRAIVERVWPWAHLFFQDQHQEAIAILTKVAEELGITPGHGAGWDIAKAIDLIKKA